MQQGIYIGQTGKELRKRITEHRSTDTSEQQITVLTGAQQF